MNIRHLFINSAAVAALVVLGSASQAYTFVNIATGAYSNQTLSSSSDATSIKISLPNENGNVNGGASVSNAQTVKSGNAQATASNNAGGPSPLQSISNVDVVNTANYDDGVNNGWGTLGQPDVPVHPTPEPGSVALAVGMLTMGAGLLRRRR